MFTYMFMLTVDIDVRCHCSLNGRIEFSWLLGVGLSLGRANFSARCTLVQSAVLRLHVVRPSVRPSVTLVDQDHIGWKSWKLIARTISPTPSLFVAQRPSTYSQEDMRKFGGY